MTGMRDGHEPGGDWWVPPVELWQEELQIGRALWVRDDDLNLRLGCDPAKCHCIYVEEVSAPRVLSYFQQDKPLCIQQRPYRYVDTGRHTHVAP